MFLWMHRHMLKLLEGWGRIRLQGFKAIQCLQMVATPPT